MFSGGAAAQLSRFDPYELLSLPRENPEHVLRLSSAPAQQLKQRSTLIREAYLDLAARLHPDSCGGTVSASTSKRAQWISDADVFTYVAAAYRLLIDLELTVQYHAAASAEYDSSGCQTADTCREDEVSSACDPYSVQWALHPPIVLQRLDSARRTVRAAEGQREAAALAPAAARSYALQQARQAAGGDGFIVLCALYGDEEVCGAGVNIVLGVCACNAVSVSCDSFSSGRTLSTRGTLWTHSTRGSRGRCHLIWRPGSSQRSRRPRVAGAPAPAA